MSKVRVVLVAFALVVNAAVSQMAFGDAWNKKTKVTFSGPVEIPGVALGPGTYVFKLVDSSSNRSIVRVTNIREDKVYATILAIPDYRVNASSKTVMYFSERPEGTPVAIKSWFYPGDNFGNRFVYPKSKAVQMASEYHQPVPAGEVEQPKEVKAIMAVPVAVATEAKKVEQYVASQFEKHDAADTAGVDGEAVKPAATEKKLPKTASPVHELALLGLFLVAGGLFTRRVIACVQQG